MAKIIPTQALDPDWKQVICDPGGLSEKILNQLHKIKFASIKLPAGLNNRDTERPTKTLVKVLVINNVETEEEIENGKNILISV